MTHQHEKWLANKSVDYFLATIIGELSILMANVAMAVGILSHGIETLDAQSAQAHTTALTQMLGYLQEVGDPMKSGNRRKTVRRLERVYRDLRKFDPPADEFDRMDDVLRAETLQFQAAIHFARDQMGLDIGREKIDSIFSTLGDLPGSTLTAKRDAVYIVRGEKPDWWPENPYPEIVFPMTFDEYVKALPDPVLRSAVSGHLGRWAWGVAENMIWDRLQDAIQAD